MSDAERALNEMKRILDCLTTMEKAPGRESGLTTQDRVNIEGLYKCIKDALTPNDAVE